MDTLLLRRLGAFGVLALAIAAFAFANVQLQRIPAKRVSLEMQVALPWFLQVVMAGGDRYLAAELAAVRALVSSVEELDPDRVKVLAQVQSDVAFLNPAHEDNYYTATAILPWEGEVDAAQNILLKAMQARPFDELPAYYYAFNVYHFHKNPDEGARWLLKAADRARSVDNRIALQNMAARWFEAGNDPAVAIGIIEAMANSVKHSAFRDYLLERVARLRALEAVTQATRRFIADLGRKPATLSELVTHRYIEAIPEDPFGFGFELGADGEPVLLNRPKGNRQ